ESGQIEIGHENPAAPFTGLRRILDSFRISKTGSEIPLLGGLVGFVSYEINQCFEQQLVGRLRQSAWPLGLYYFVDTLLVFDHFTRRMKLLRLNVAGDSLTAGGEPLSEAEVRETLLHEVVTPATDPQGAHNGYRSNFQQADFEQAVVKVQDYIHRGDTFQTVISQREQHQSAVDPFQVYRSLRMLNPSPYMYFLDFDGLQLIGSSPEALVKLKGRQAIVRPIAGTRRRGRDLEDERRMAAELLHDEKERAEHVMLVDLARNDLGRVCEFGSVQTSKMFNLEYYSHVMHMTSIVEGELRADHNQFDLFRAAFPAGTVSGAPKPRAMQIIAELEPEARGPYAGAVGYFSLSGDLDQCITIRTIVRKDGTYYLQAGAGIVADSVPAQEFLETTNKIAALKEALRQSEEGVK
ncbi:MAG: anthranilate synthase component I family protein, partial [bacterium]